MSYTLTEIDYRKHNSNVSLCHTLSQKQTIENTIIVSVYVILSQKQTIKIHQQTQLCQIFTDVRNRLQKTQYKMQQCQFMSINLTEIDQKTQQQCQFMSYTFTGIDYKTQQQWQFMSYTFTEIDQKTQQQCQFMSCNLTEIDYRKHNNSVSLCHTLSQKQIIKIHQLTQLMSNFHRNRLENKKYVQG